MLDLLDGLESLIKQKQQQQQQQQAAAAQRGAAGGPTQAPAAAAAAEEAPAIPRFTSWAAAQAYVEEHERGEFEKRRAKEGGVGAAAALVEAGGLQGLGAAGPGRGGDDDDDASSTTSSGSSSSSSSSGSSSGSYSDDEDGEEGEESTVASSKSVQPEEEEGGEEGVLRGRWAVREKTEDDLEAEAAFERAYAGMVTASVEERQAAARAGGGGLLALSADKMVLPSTLPEIVRRVGMGVWMCRVASCMSVWGSCVHFDLTHLKINQPEQEEEDAAGGWGGGGGGGSHTSGGAGGNGGVTFCMLKRGNRGRLEAREVKKIKGGGHGMSSERRLWGRGRGWMHGISIAGGGGLIDQPT